MRGFWAAAVVVCAVGCAGTKQTGAVRPATETAPVAAAPQTRDASQPQRFVDQEYGFSIERPGERWTFKPSDNLSTEHIAVPLVISDTATNAQVVVQIAPAVATPAQFAERLTVGLQSRAGFVTTDIQPIPLADGAVGFDFKAGEEVLGKVAILEGEEGKVYVLLATWPTNAGTAVEQDVDRILGSMRREEQELR
ncbi:MAG: hypothetical protein ACK4N5_15035 [Myxococcales bacterium]